MFLTCLTLSCCSFGYCKHFNDRKFAFLIAKSGAKLQPFHNTIQIFSQLFLKKIFKIPQHTDCEQIAIVQKFA